MSDPMRASTSRHRASRHAAEAAVAACVMALAPTAVRAVLVIFSNASFAAYELEGRIAKLLFGAPTTSAAPAGQRRQR